MPDRQASSAANEPRPWCECDPEYDGRCPYPCQIDADEKCEAASAATTERQRPKWCGPDGQRKKRYHQDERTERTHPEGEHPSGLLRHWWVCRVCGEGTWWW